MQEQRRISGWAVGLPLLRVALVATASALTWLAINGIDPGVVFPPPPVIAVIAMLPVNLVCLMIVTRLLRREGRTLRELFAYEPRRIASDLCWGLLWVVVMYLPFAGAIILVVWLQHGDRVFAAMETVFFDPASIPALDPAVWSVVAIVGVLTFAPLNAPVEELVYRGYAQGALARRVPTFVAIVVPAAIFALQHVWYAPSPGAVVAFVCAFFVWGVGSGLIYRFQRRLMPLVFAHGLVNLVFSLPALAIPVLVASIGA
ncbi:lysostaphin resistance A-like protein [Microbacterium sp. NPDC056234]|uniref:CPBP family intramembrane glutamic endopeptidase n=1 Tax=Microbacterium sp. NPDC056234 TaxID=3345757 RepID=UPI0035D9CC84